MRSVHSPESQADATGALFTGIDASVKHDSTALVAIKYAEQDDSLVLAES